MVEVKIRLSKAEWRALESVADNEEHGLEPAEVAADTVRRRLGPLPLIYQEEDTPSDDPRELLRARYRPDDVELLFVGESAPSGGTYFYQSDSHLFRAIREACQRAYGRVPDGPAFLAWFQQRHFWLYDLSISPVNRMRGRPRRDSVDAGILPLARLLRELDPDFVMAVKESIAPAVRAAANLAGMSESRVIVLPFPLYQWRRRFVDELSTFLGAASRTPARHADNADGTEGARPSRELSTLHEAMARVLEAAAGPMSSREIANAIARERLYTRRDGASPPPSQVAARARKYPVLFETGPAGIALIRSRGTK